MGVHGLIFAKESTAAKLLDMGTQEFRKLVASGALPPPIKITKDCERWPVADLERLRSGAAALPSTKEDIEL